MHVCGVKKSIHAGNTLKCSTVEEQNQKHVYALRMMSAASLQNHDCHEHMVGTTAFCLHRSLVVVVGVHAHGGGSSLATN